MPPFDSTGRKSRKFFQLAIVAGARPNFIKIAPIIRAIKKALAAGKKLKYRLVHTGQHYDLQMSRTFFEELGIPEPDVNLGAGGGTQAEQTAAIMTAFEKELAAHPADLVLVVGDVNSTLACSIVAKKANVRVAHVEAGLRSFDWSMPEEINRVVTDSLTDYFFTTLKTANENLKKAGIKKENIFFVGNVMIDTLLANRPRFRAPSFYSRLGLREKRYFVMTLHRPANVDKPPQLKALLNAVTRNARELPVIFPAHPRTAKVMKKIGTLGSGLHIIKPLGYLEFNYLVQHSKAVVTDSGGITEETTVMGVPCMTLRDNTERPETCSIGTNELIGTDPAGIRPAMERLFRGRWKKGKVPELWDGRAAERIVNVIADL